MIKTILTLVIILMCYLNGYTQKIERLSIAATSEAIGLPFTNYLPIHPGFEIKVTLKNKETDKSKHQYNHNLGAFFHSKVENALYFGGEYQYTRKLFNQKLGLDFPVGLGYLHSFYPSELYIQNDDGSFEKKAQLGRSHLYINLGVGLTYINEGKIEPFIRQELLVETPFGNGIPVIPHSLLKIGVNIKMN